MKLVTLCSGGLDSTTLAYHLAREGHTQALLFVNYNQKHLNKEHFSADACARDLGVSFKYVTIISKGLFKSALTDRKLEIPSGEYAPENLAVTVVPNRNSVMANLAAALAVSLDYDGIAMAMHAGDHAIYPDCTPQFVLALEYLLSVATGREQRRLKVVAPFLHGAKSLIVLRGAMLGVPFKKTWSCYKGGELHCGVCSTCTERKKAFIEAGVEDPTRYEQ
jgi:7-cyano-7-deazaguanine synthase